jgi:hypothetical protein
VKLASLLPEEIRDVYEDLHAAINSPVDEKKKHRNSVIRRPAPPNLTVGNYIAANSLVHGDPLDEGEVGGHCRDREIKADEVLIYNHEAGRNLSAVCAESVRATISFSADPNSSASANSGKRHRTQCGHDGINVHDSKSKPSESSSGNCFYHCKADSEQHA